MDAADEAAIGGFAQALAAGRGGNGGHNVSGNNAVGHVNNGLAGSRGADGAATTPAQTVDFK